MTGLSKPSSWAEFQPQSAPAWVAKSYVFIYYDYDYYYDYYCYYYQQL